MHCVVKTILIDAISSCRFKIYIGFYQMLSAILEQISFLQFSPSLLVFAGFIDFLQVTARRLVYHEHWHTGVDEHIYRSGPDVLCWAKFALHSVAASRYIKLIVFFILMSLFTWRKKKHSSVQCSVRNFRGSPRVVLMETVYSPFLCCTDQPAFSRVAAVSVFKLQDSCWSDHPVVTSSCP